MSNDWTWGQNLDDFPSVDIEPWRFYADPTDEEGSEPVHARIGMKADRILAELVMQCMARGMPFKTKSDLIRVAIYKFMEELKEYLNIQDHDIQMYMLVQRQSMRLAQEAESLSSAKVSVKKLATGLSRLVASDQREYQEAKNMIADFLSPIMALAGGQEVLMRVWLKEIFSNRSFRVSLAVVRKQEIHTGGVIDNAERAYLRITEHYPKPAQFEPEL